MTRREIFEALKQLPILERLSLIESISEEFGQRQVLSADADGERRNKMVAASEALLTDYTSDRELIAFTSESSCA